MSIPPETLLLFALSGVVSGTVDAIAGGGGLIALPVLILGGLDPAAAVATNKLQGTLGTATATTRFARAGLLDALSSDYVPASLLQAVERLTHAPGLPLHEAFALVTSKPAAMLGFSDRGRLAPGLRADLVRLRFMDGTPVLRSLSVAGRRAL
ncbi:TSUP family transporter [Hansschlegelia beijingensis]|uniref:TSUP family transporter n=1 Tax=Hansschlegelia beijingensis TaxID=1133344 RepID=UPI00387F1876